MILEAGALLCWVVAHVQHCGTLNGGTFTELSVVDYGQVKFSCKDGSFPNLIRMYPEISGLYNVTCGADFVEPEREATAFDSDACCKLGGPVWNEHPAYDPDCVPSRSAWAHPPPCPGTRP